MLEKADDTLAIEIIDTLIESDETQSVDICSGGDVKVNENDEFDRIVFF